MKPAAERFKVGDIVRYGSGISALFRYEGPVNVGRLYGTHVLGGAIGASDQTFFDLQPASAEDIEFCKGKQPGWFPADETRQSPTKTVSHETPGRQWIIDLIRDQFDPAPSHYKLGDNWDDGAPAIAEAIFAQLPLLITERQKELAAKLAAEPGLSSAEMKAQARRCSCRGSDDYCTCQNVPDHATRAQRQLNTFQRPEGED